MTSMPHVKFERALVSVALSNDSFIGFLPLFPDCIVFMTDFSRTSSNILLSITEISCLYTSYSLTNFLCITTSYHRSLLTVHS